MSAGKSHVVRSPVGGACAALLGNAHGHKLGATLRASFSTHQATLTQAVTLVA
jgi:hypothetical protein